jgi:pimeloyl-ACP methyl ester carboxylesterase
MKSPELNYPLPENNDSDKSKESLDMEYGELSPEEQQKMKIVNEQFDNPKFVEIPIPGNENEKIKVEYVVLDARGEEDIDENDKTMVYVPGFSGSYRAPEKFIKLMAARENKRVINISLPSTGKSDNMPTESRKWEKSERSFEFYADILNNSFDTIRENEKEDGQKSTEEISLVSSSMGSVVATEMALKYPDKIKDLVLVHPAGINEESIFQLAKRFVVEKVRDKKALLTSPKIDPAHKKELEDSYKEMFGKSLQEAYEEAGGDRTFDLQYADTQAHAFNKAAANDILKDGTPNTMKNPLWRAWEAFTIANGAVLKMLPKVKANTYIIYGGNDKLFPSEQIEKIRDNMPSTDNVRIDTFPSMGHDSIYQDARKYSASIGTFLDKMRKKGD